MAQEPRPQQLEELRRMHCGEHHAQVAGPRRGLPTLQPPPSVQQAGLVGGDHVLDVDEGVFAAVALQGPQRLLDQVPHVLPLLLTVLDAVSGVHWFRQTHKEAHYCPALSQKVPRVSLGVPSACLLGAAGFYTILQGLRCRDKCTKAQSLRREQKKSHLN